MRILNATALAMAYCFILYLQMPFPKLLVFAPFAFLSSYLLFNAKDLNKGLVEKEEEEKATLSAFRNASYYSGFGMPFIVALSKVLKHENGMHKQKLLHAIRTSLLGGYAKIPLDDPGSFMKEQELRQDRKAHELEGSLQTYATINMFVSVVLPSFLIFAFVGESVLQGANSMGLLSSVLLFVIPIFYALVNIIKGRRLYE